jgi:hypothetical protein
MRAASQTIAAASRGARVVIAEYRRLFDRSQIVGQRSIRMGCDENVEVCCKCEMNVVFSDSFNSFKHQLFNFTDVKWLRSSG